jgi:hypothetical protein
MHVLLVGANPDLAPDDVPSEVEVRYAGQVACLSQRQPLALVRDGKELGRPEERPVPCPRYSNQSA